MKNMLKFSIFMYYVFATVAFSQSAQAETPKSYPMVCRGGGSSIFEIIPDEGKTIVVFDFKKTNRPATAGLSDGSCAWLDRSISSGEPSRLRMIFNGVSVGTKLQRKVDISAARKQKSQLKKGTLEYVGSTYTYSGNGPSEMQLFKNVFAAFKNGTEFQIYAYVRPGRVIRSSSGRNRRIRAIFVATKVGP